MSVLGDAGHEYSCQKKALTPLDLELQWVLKTELREEGRGTEKNI